MSENRQVNKNEAATSSSSENRKIVSSPRLSRGGAGVAGVGGGGQLKFIGVRQTVRQQQEQQADDKTASTTQDGDKLQQQPLRACGCAFKFSPARNRTLSYRHKAASKSEDKLSGIISREQRERSKSCTPISNEKFSASSIAKKKIGVLQFADFSEIRSSVACSKMVPQMPRNPHYCRINSKVSSLSDDVKKIKQTSTMVKFSSENVLNTDSNKEDQKEDKLVLIPEVYGEHRFQTTFWWEPRALPYKYSTSVYIDTNTAAKYYVEEVSMKVRLVPCPYVESLGTLHRYKSTVEANVQSPTIIETTFHLTGKFNNETII